jgi:L-amino acid N-acyltransferase YncA
MVRIRSFEPADLDDVFAIYDYEVLNGTATFDTVPPSSDSRRHFITVHSSPRHPAIVAVQNDGRLVGWASISPYSNRSAYDRTAEISVYVHPDHRAAGIGRALLEALIETARAVGLAVLLARITRESVASIALHRKLGFSSVGTLRRVGEKFGRILDVEVLDLHLDE